MADLTTITGGGAFTRQNIAGINANFAAVNQGGGGASILHQATVTLGDDDIKHIPPDRFLILASPGAGKVTIPVIGSAIVDTLAGAYTADSTPGLQLMWGVGSPLNASNVIGDALLLTQAQNPLTGFSAPYSRIGTGDLANYFTSGRVPVSGAVDAALYIYDNDNDGGNAYGGGDAANSMKLSFTYLILNTSTGLFE